MQEDGSFWLDRAKCARMEIRWSATCPMSQKRNIDRAYEQTLNLGNFGTSKRKEFPSPYPCEEPFGRRRTWLVLRFHAALISGAADLAPSRGSGAGARAQAASGGRGAGPRERMGWESWDKSRGLLVFMAIWVPVPWENSGYSELDKRLSAFCRVNSTQVWVCLLLRLGAVFGERETRRDTNPPKCPQANKGLRINSYPDCFVLFGVSKPILYISVDWNRI